MHATRRLTAAEAVVPLILLSTATPGIVGAALTRGEVLLGLIADPSHLALESVRLAFQAAPGRGAGVRRCHPHAREVVPR